MNRDNYVTILAIYDDPPIISSSSGSSPTVITVDKSTHRRRYPDTTDGVVEITNLNEPPSYGLKVVSEAPNYSGRNSPFLPQHRSEHSSSSTTASFQRSPTSESLQKPFQSNSSGSSRHNNSKESNMASAAAAAATTNLSRTQARKSRFTDAFLDARDRLEESNENHETYLNITDSNLRQMKVILAAESINIPLGIEISAVPDLNDNRRTRILAVEVRKIDDDGRVALDGRIKVGDQITDINHRPVYQMSLPAAQARLHELQFVEEPLLVVVTRRTGDEIIDSAPKALKTTALQQANTTKTGEVLYVKIKKSSAGFGFGVKSRVNTRAETLICINSVSINGPAYNKLQIGDRLLKINDTEVGTFSQAEVVEMLKKTAVGSSISFCISRMANENEHAESDAPQQSTSALNKPLQESLEMVHKRRQSAFVDILDENVEFLTFDVQLINSRSAGLGISLKGGKLYPESGTLESGVDCGLFVKGILHGSAAFHDGRFRENDRLIGIENLDLREYKHNADALAAFTNTLGNVPLQQKSVKIHIVRCKDYPAIDFGRKSSMIKKDITSYKATSANVDGYESEVSLAPDSEAFNRENRIRKSISEKKHPFGSGKDAIHAQAYQKILHQRQTSGLKPRSLSHEPLSSKENIKSKEDAMIHEVIAGTKAGTLQPGNVLRRKKIEPAPSFKMAMSNSQPAFGNSEGEQVQDFHPEMLRDKNKRKSTGGFFRFLQRGSENSPQKHGNNDDYEIAPRLPPPYNAPHRPIPPAVPPHGSQAYRYPRTTPGPISHHRIHSAQESTSSMFEPEAVYHYQKHCYDGSSKTTDYEQAPPHVVQYTDNMAGRAPSAYHIFHPTTAYVGPSPHQQQQFNIHQRQLLQQQQRERALQNFQPSYNRRNNGDYIMGPPPPQPPSSGQQQNSTNNNCDYYDAFNTWFTQTARPLGGRYITPTARRQSPPMAGDFNNYEASPHSISTAFDAQKLQRSGHPASHSSKQSTNHIGATSSSAFAQFAPTHSHSNYPSDATSTYRF